MLSNRTSHAFKMTQFMLLIQITSQVSTSIFFIKRVKHAFKQCKTCILVTPQCDPIKLISFFILRPQPVDRNHSFMKRFKSCNQVNHALMQYHAVKTWNLNAGKPLSTYPITRAPNVRSKVSSTKPELATRHEC